MKIYSGGPSIVREKPYIYAAPVLDTLDAALSTSPHKTAIIPPPGGLLHQNRPFSQAKKRVRNAEEAAGKKSQPSSRAAAAAAKPEKNLSNSKSQTNELVQ